MIVTDLKRFRFLKRAILPALILSFGITCNLRSGDNDNRGIIQEPDPVEGVWELINQYWIKDGDTLYLGPDELALRHKIYFDGYVICTDAPTSDSEVWYGYGTYSLSNGTLTEKLETISLPMMTALGVEDEIVYQTEFGKNFLKQETSSLLRGTVYLLVEEWKKLNQ